MPYASQLDSAAARAAIARGDNQELTRYLREGGSNPVQNITTATANLQFGTNLFNRGAGIASILPIATGSQGVVMVVIQTLVAGSTTIRTAVAADEMSGGLLGPTTTAGAGIMIAATQTGAAATHSDTITMNGTTTGGGVGSVIEFTDIAPGLWLVRGSLVAVGALTTPFSAAV